MSRPHQSRYHPIHGAVLLPRHHNTWISSWYGIVNKTGPPGGVSGHPQAWYRSVSWVRAPPSVYLYKFVGTFSCWQIDLRKARESELATVDEQSTSSGIAEPYGRYKLKARNEEEKGWHLWPRLVQKLESESAQKKKKKKCLQRVSAVFMSGTAGMLYIRSPNTIVSPPAVARRKGPTWRSLDPSFYALSAVVWVKLRVSTKIALLPMLGSRWNAHAHHHPVVHIHSRTTRSQLDYWGCFK